MRIELDLKIILLGLLFFFTKNFDIYIIFLISIILHEMGHLIAGSIFGFRPQKVLINQFGVSLEFYNYRSKTKLNKIITYFAGPITNLIILILFLKFDVCDISLRQKIAYTNLILAIFNMFPILPLDGGKILKEILIKNMGIKKATYTMIFISKIFLIIMTLLYSILILKIKNIFIFMLIIYLWYLFFIENRKANLIYKVYELIEKK